MTSRGLRKNITEPQKHKVSEGGGEMEKKWSKYRGEMDFMKKEGGVYER